MKTITLANHKGGCAKTTTALNLSVTLALTGSRVLAVDLDQQGNLSASLGFDLEELEETQRTALRLMLDAHGDYSQYRKNVRPRLDLIPCSLDDDAEAIITASASRELLLKEKLAAAQGEFDYCVIDTPPSLATPTLNALAMSDLTIVPVDTGMFALLGLKQLRRKVTRISRHFSPDMQLVALSTKFTAKNRVDRGVREAVIQRFGRDYVLETTIPELVAVEEATLNKMAVVESAPDSPAAFAFRKLIKELKELMGDEEAEHSRTGRVAK